MGCNVHNGGQIIMIMRNALNLTNLKISIELTNGGFGGEDARGGGGDYG
jgi:hypothetical protein